MVDKYADLPPLIPGEMNPPLNRTLVTEGSGLEKVSAFFSRVNEVGLDLETNVTSTFYDRRIRTVTVGDRNEQYVIDLLAFAGNSARLVAGQGFGRPAEWATPVVDVLRPALDSNRWLKVGQNLEFEYTTLKWCLGIRTWHLFSIDLAEKVLKAGLVNFFESDYWGLEDLVARYLKYQTDKSLQKSFDLTTALTEAQIDYAALDIRLPLAVRRCQLPEIAAAKLGRVVQIEMDTIPAFGDLHLNGLFLNREKWIALVEKSKKKYTEQIAVLDVYFAPVVGRHEKPKGDLDALETRWRDLGVSSEAEKSAKRDERKLLKQARLAERKQARDEFYTVRKQTTAYRKNQESYEGVAAINYGSNKQLRDALLSMPGFNSKNLPDTNDRTLKKLAGKAVIDALRSYRATQKSLDSYGLQWVRTAADEGGGHIHTETGRIHPSFNQLGAETGRTSCSKPNVQNLPKDEEVRACFESRPGFKFLTVDQSGAELRIIADAAGARSWIDAFNRGWDVHSVGAEILYPNVWPTAGLPDCAYFTKDHQKCKCPEHKKLRDGNKSTNFLLAYGGGARKLAEQIGSTEDEASALLQLHRSKFPDVWDYLERSGLDAKQKLESRTMTGRRRFFTKPSYDKARARAVERLQEKGQNRLPTSDEIGRCFKAFYAAIEREGKNSPIQGCVVGTTRIFEQFRGYVQIKDVVNQQVNIWDGVRFASAFVVSSGHKTLVEIETKDGGYIGVSPDHKFLTKGTAGRSKWKTAKQIRKQDRLIMTNPVSEWRGSIWFNGLTDTTLIGEWLGRLASDGSVSSNGTITQFVAEHEEAILPHLAAVTNKLGLLRVVVGNSSRTANQKQKLHFVRVCSRALAKSLVSMGIKTRIPEMLWSDRRALAGYLRGMFDGDGHVAADGAVLTFGRGKTHLTWAREVQQALRLLGVRSRINAYEHGSHNRINLRILKRDMPLYCQTVGFINDKKTAKALLVKDKRNKARLSTIYGAGIAVKNISIKNVSVPMFDVVDSASGQFMADGLVVHNSNADFIKLAMGCGADADGKPYLWHQLEPMFGAFLVNMVHDELGVESPDATAEECFKAIGDAFVRSAGEFLKHVKMEFEGQIDTKWRK